MNIRRTIRLGAVMCGSLLSIACSSSGSGPDGGGAQNSSGGSGNGSCKTYVACDKLSPSDVNTALGVNVGAGVEADSTIGTIASYACEFMQDTSTSVSLTISCDSSGAMVDPAAIEQALAGNSGTVTPVSGIGNAAFWITRTPDAGFLADVKNFDVYFSGNSNFGLTLILPQDFPGDAQMGAETLARQVLGKL